MANLIETPKHAAIPGLSSEQLAIALFMKDKTLPRSVRAPLGRSTALTGNLLVRARAGTGKTYLIRKCIPLMHGKIAIAAYNRKIASEIRQKLQADGVLRGFADQKAGRDGVDVGTFHSYGFRVLRECIPGVRVEGRDGDDAAGFFKFDRIVERLDIPQYLRLVVRKAMERAQERLFGVVDPRTGRPFIAFGDRQAWRDLAEHYALDQELPSDDHIELQLIRNKLGPDASAEEARDILLQHVFNFAARGLQISIRMARETFKAVKTIGRGAARRQIAGQEFTGVISYGEMIYLPLYFNMPMPQYDFVCIDEAQDSNAGRREMARRMMKPTGRAMFVGDDFQAINGWCGADNDALDRIVKQFDCVIFPMTVTFRCAKAIVRKAQALVPDYKAADSNPEGVVREISEDEFAAEVLRPGVDENGTPLDAVICRNTAPLIKLAYKLIGRGVACHVEGKDVGKDIIKLVQRWPHLKTVPAFVSKLTEYRELEIAKLMEKEQDAAAERLADQVDTVLAIIDSLPKHSRVSDIETRIDSLFADTKEGEKPKTVTLVSAHRSKGLEFKRVFGLGVAKYMPSKYAKQDWALEQENHLIYVLFTRAIEEYVDVVVG